MRRIIMVGSILCAGALALSAFRGAPRSDEIFGVAEISVTQATHFENFVCGMGPAGLTTDSRTVVTPSGNATLVCRTQTAVGPPETIVQKDFLCGTQGGLAFDNTLVWTKSGQATLVCHVK